MTRSIARQRDFLLPSLGAGTESARVVAWLVAPGDAVAGGSAIMRLETGNGVVEVELLEGATIDETLVAAGDIVATGRPIARLSAAPEGAGSAPATTPMRIEEVEGTGPDGAVTREDVRQATRRRAFSTGSRQPAIRVSPLGRRLATELGVELSGVAGTGPDGVITRADVEHAATGQRPAGPEEQRAAEEVAAAREVFGDVQGRAIASGDPTGPGPMSRGNGPRPSVAHGMLRSSEVPYYYLSTSIDMSVALSWLEEYNRERPTAERVQPGALLLKAAALAVSDVPEMNGFFEHDEFHPSVAVDIGVAVALGSGGLVAPVIRDADRLPLDDLMAALGELLAKGRQLPGPGTARPTITVVDLGEHGVADVFPVVFAPQVAVVAFGAIIEQPVARAGMLAVRPLISATLAGDHRVGDEHRGARYLNGIARRLAEPATL